MQRSRNAATLFGLAALAALGLGARPAQADFTFTTLSDPNATGATVAYGINNAGDIAGYYTDASGTHGFLYSGGTYQTIDGPSGAGGTNPFGINNMGDIAGYYTDASGGSHGFLDSSGVFQDIDDPNAPQTVMYDYSNAFGVNDSGDIVGHYNDVSTGGHGFLYTPSSGFMTLDEPDETTGPAYGTQLLGINKAGSIVGIYETGTYNTPSYGSHGFLYTPGDGQFTTLDDPNAVSSTYAFGINNAGDIVGNYVDASGSSHGFLDSGGTFQTLGVAKANGANAIVAFQTLDDPNAVGFTSAYGINDSGMIVGSYKDANGNSQSFFATPNAAPAVPEPGSLALLTLGLLPVGAVAASRRKA